MSEKLRKKWYNMKDRCYNTKAHNYKNYGGRGITICDEWLHSYEAFEKWSLEHGYDPNGKNQSIDRIDSNGNYCPENCRYTDNKTQQNNRTNNHLITYKGETLTLQLWCDKLGLSNDTLEKRIKRGWDLERAFTQPQKIKHMKKGN